MLVIVILILIAWAVIKIVEDVRNPKLPPIDNIDEHLKKIQSIPNKKARQRYLRDLANGKVTEKDDVTKYK